MEQPIEGSDSATGRHSPQNVEMSGPMRKQQIGCTRSRFRVAFAGTTEDALSATRAAAREC